MLSVNMPEVYGFHNYRLYLSDQIEERRRASRAFSLRALATKAGFASHTFLPKVIAGQRNLTAESSQRIAEALDLQGPEARFFCTLVEYNQCPDEEERGRLYRELIGIFEAGRRQLLDTQHAHYYDQWYYPVIRHVAAYADWGGDFGRLAALVVPPITARQAQSAVEELCAMGLLRQEGAGWRLSASTINVDGLPLVARSKGRRDILMQGVAAQERYSSAERFTYCALLSMDDATRDRIMELLRQAGRRALEEASQDHKVNRVYQAVLQLFPATQAWEPVRP